METMIDIQQRKENLSKDMQSKGYTNFEVSYYGNFGNAVVMAFHRAEFIRMLAIELDEIMNRHNAYCVGHGDKLIAIFK